MRHAKSDWNVPSSDYQRPLNKRGVKAATKMGPFVAQYCRNQLSIQQPDSAISSGATRAFSTAKLLFSSAQFQFDGLQTSDALYTFDWQEVLDVIRAQQPTTKTLLLFGHNPAFESLLNQLSRCQLAIPDDGKLFPTAAFAHMIFDDAWPLLKPNSGEVKNLTRVRALNSS